jgi:RNA polymerase sigma-70 factor (ECF subfamily)
MSSEPEATQDYDSLLAAARAGDATSFWKMCEGLRPRLRNFAAGQLDPAVAAKVDPSDLVQNALLAAVRAFPQFRGKTTEEWEAWLTQIVRREVHDERRYWHQPRRSVRRQANNLEAIDNGNLLPADGSSPSTPSLRKEQAEKILDLVARLPADEERVVRLRHFEGKSLNEIAELIGRTPDGTAGLLKRAMARLRESLPELA